MSDIIYTPPASSGGGQNPTTNYIPLNNGTSNFVDSNIFNLKDQQLVTNYLGTFEGLYIEFPTKFIGIGDVLGNYNGTTVSVDYALGNIYLRNYTDSIYIGDTDYDANNTYLQITDTTQIIKTHNGVQDVGLKLDFASKEYSFGDYIGVVSQTYLYFDVPNQYCNLSAAPINLIVDGGNQFIKTIFGGNDIGLKLDFTTNEYFFGNIQNGNFGVYCVNGQSKLGDAYGNTNGIVVEVNDTAGIINLVAGVGLTLDVSTNIIETYAYANYKGLKLDLANKLYSLGDYNLVDNGTYIQINDANQNLDFYLNNKLQFFGGSLVSASASGASGDHLIIWINGNQYKIQLLNP